MNATILELIDIDEYDEKDPHWTRIDSVNLAIAQEAYFSKLTRQDRKTFDYIYSALRKCKGSQNLFITMDVFDFAKKSKLVIPNNEDETMSAVFEAFCDLGEKSNWLQFKDSTEVLVGWLKKVELNRNNKTITVKLDKTFAKYQYHMFENLSEVRYA